MMMRDYFGHDPELPGGFQDADLEMAELEEAAERIPMIDSMDRHMAKGMSPTAALNAAIHGL